MPATRLAGYLANCRRCLRDTIARDKGTIPWAASGTRLAVLAGSQGDHFHALSTIHLTGVRNRLSWRLHGGRRRDFGQRAAFRRQGRRRQLVSRERGRREWLHRRADESEPRDARPADDVLQGG